MTDEVLNTPLPKTYPSPGAQLARQRERHNMSVADVAAKLRIAARQIDALEADDYAKLPGHAIARGFLRNYAKLLQLDPEPLLETFEARAPHEAGRISLPSQNVRFNETPQTRKDRRLLIATAAIALLTLGGFAAWHWENNLNTYFKGASRTVDANGAAPARALSPQPSATAPPAEPAVLAQPESAAVATESAAAAGTVPGAAPEIVAKADSPAPQAVEPAADPGAPASSQATVRLQFAKQTWIEVRDAKRKVVLVKTVAAGGEQEIREALPLSFTIANAQDVKMTYNGEPFDLAPHTQKTVARFKLE
jgi:cytoskeleton protein RodZ